MNPILSAVSMLRRFLRQPLATAFIIVVTVAGLTLARQASAGPCGPFYGLGFIQSTYGSFEVVAPAAAGGMVHYWRNNSTNAVPWSSPAPFATGDVHGVTLIQSNFTTNGVQHLEAVATVGSNLVLYWRDDGGTWQWTGPIAIGSGVRGTPGFVQSKWGGKGNFEVVVPRAAGGLAHYWSNNDAAGRPWSAPIVFGNTGVVYDAVAMIQSNFDQGNLEIVARTGNTLHHYWRADGSTWQWYGPTIVATGVQGTPSYIQSRNGGKGNFELLTPMAGGGLAHYWRNNDSTAYPWYGPNYVPGVNGNVSAVAVIRSTYGTVGNLEYVAHVNGELQTGWRDDGNTWMWNGPYAFSAQACCAPDQKGAWGDAFDGQIVGTHSVLMRDGNVLFYGFTDTSELFGESRIISPLAQSASGTTFSGDYHPIAFCAGQSAMADGRIFVAGGHAQHVATAHIFDPGSRNWSFVGNFNDGRWYPTTATLPNGNVFIIGGSRIVGRDGSSANNFNNTWQIFSPSAGLLPAQPIAPYPFSADNFGPIDLYPFVYLLPDGRLFVHSRNSSRLFNPNNGLWDAARFDTNWPFSRSYPGTGTSVLMPLMPNANPPYRPQVMVMGGAASNTPVLGTPATATVELLDLGSASPAWINLPAMNYPRVMPDSVLLPDGKIFVVNGSTTGRADSAAAPVLAPEIYDPATYTWSTLCPMRVPRLYHGTAILLPDARVLVAGKDGLFNAIPYMYPEHRVEIYNPPYLFRGTRPSITGAPTTITYGANFAVGVGQVASSAIGRVALIRLGANTHSMNMDQRYVGLNFSAQSGSLTLQAPPNAAVAPPGYYMLFVVTGTGVPSVARIVQLL